ncbi:putative serine dehydratase domain-containing protein [Trichoderma breve]|uniref:D-serine dehydratase n=1 Tax=Trichoderma breve TaxID=2034170 RepID=A0A9W9E646_9HYPO|nr:putative serine dehydratase domain-containing protein [Trichoderma breve]KAJ4857977.1 putative serine dehydratase domain-containing protein [Trichoderma breve]
MHRHCKSLLDAVEYLGVDFRAHVKTHKTLEGVRLQAGEGNKDVRLVASTVAEIEFLQPLLHEFMESGRQVNVLYGIPLPPSQVDRLAAIGRRLGQGTISVMIDHVSQLSHVVRFAEQASFPAGVYLKVDTGYHRAGLPPSGLNKDDLVSRLINLDNEGKINFIGLYSHSSLSYNDSTAKQAMANLGGELTGCLDALEKNAHLFSSDKEITISVGASPQTLHKVVTERHCGFRTKLELHAGVYSLLDVQQFSTHSRAHLGDYEDEIAISVMAEVCSVYNDGERQQPEALLAVGVLGLGREPCAAYEGWGIIDRDAYSPDTPNLDRRLIVKRVSQEHCIVSWGLTKGHDDENSQQPIPLEVGQTVRIYPNHACITGALYGWYYVVDSSEDGHRVVDVWERANGWKMPIAM